MSEIVGRTAVGGRSRSPRLAISVLNSRPRLCTWTAGLLDCWSPVGGEQTRRPEDQKTRKPLYRYWSAVHVEVLILLFVADVHITNNMGCPPCLRHGVGCAENTVLVWFPALIIPRRQPAP